MGMMTRIKTASCWMRSLLLRCGDIETNPGPEDRVRTSIPSRLSRVSLASIRSTIEKRKRELYIEATPIFGSCRLILAFMGFLGFLNVYAMRVNLSVAMVCMINQTAIRTSVETPAQPTSDQDAGRCGSQTGNSSASNSEDGEFAWSKEIQGMILGSFFWGYMTTQIAGGWLGARFGGKRVYGYFMFACSVFTLIMPVAARTDYRFLLVLRVLAGVTQGVTFPAMNVLWASWAPPLESSKLASLSYSGSQLGNVLTFPVAGLLCEYGFDGGWPTIFYLLGFLGLAWFVAWSFLVYDSPAEHPRISPAECAYITASLEGKMTANREASSHVPWLTLLRSRAVWGIIITHTCSNFGTYTFLTNIPTYLKEVLHFDIKENGLLSALPYIGFWLTIILSGQLADLTRAHGLLTTTQTRKVGNSLGMLLPGIFVAAVGYMTCEQSTTAVVLLTLGVSMSGFQYGSGWMVNAVDIAPKYAGVIFGISNTLATIPGFLAPIAIGVITKNQTQKEWQTVFFIATGIYTVGALGYILLGSGDLQPWARQGQSQPGSVRRSERDLKCAVPECNSLLSVKDEEAGTDMPRKTTVSFVADKGRLVDAEKTNEGQQPTQAAGEETGKDPGAVQFY